MLGGHLAKAVTSSAMIYNWTGPSNLKDRSFYAKHEAIIWEVHRTVCSSAGQFSVSWVGRPLTDKNKTNLDSKSSGQTCFRAASKEGKFTTGLRQASNCSLGRWRTVNPPSASRVGCSRQRNGPLSWDRLQFEPRDVKKMLWEVDRRSDIEISESNGKE